MKVTLPDPDRPYLKDELDLAAYKLYCDTLGGVPPVRNELNDAEKRAWNVWRERAKGTNCT